MSLTLAPVDDADWATIAQLERDSFRTNGGMSLLFATSETIPPDELEKSVKERIESRVDSPWAHHMKVVDGATGQLIAYGYWNINLKARTEAEMDKMLTTPPPPPTAVVAAWNDFFAWFREVRGETLGPQPAAFLNVLTTHPDHFRRGAGTMLVKYGCDIADENGIRAYLEASDKGRPLYERFGFKKLMTRNWDVTKYGGEGVENCTVMERPAKDKPSS